jgi:hypothetical protein
MGALKEMNFFKKQLKTKICLIKTVELTKNGWETKYHTEVNGSYVSNSISEQQEKAELFFEKVLENNGSTKMKEVVKEEYR